MRSIVRAVLGLLVLAAPTGAALQDDRPNHRAEATAQGTSIADLVVRDLCGKRIALLGEAPMHGFGATLQFKVEVARRLVDECHFNAFFIESGAYDFLAIQKELEAGRTVGDSTIAAAIGGLWAYREVEPLIPFLAEKVRRNAIVLAGLDDQLARGTYAQRRMPGDLTAQLEGDEKARCLRILQRHTLWQYTADSPYSANDKALILGCLDAIEAKLATSNDRVAREYEPSMIENLRRLFARDFRQETLVGADLTARDFNDRDQSMYMNFQWWMSRLSARSKVIVWTATIHAAKDLSRVPGNERKVPLGSYIRRAFRSDAFVLGVSAYAGSYAMGRQPARPLPEAPDNSIEARAFDRGDGDVRYVGPNDIRTLGSVPARPLGAAFTTASWHDVLDGLVIFREEHPPHPSTQ